MAEGEAGVMSFKLLWFIGAVIGIVPLESHAGQATNTLCDTQQTVYFSCKTQKGKIISVCGANEKNKDSRYLKYLYGNSKKIDFAFPNNDSKELSGFQFHYDGGTKWSESILSFSSAGYRYYVFDNRSSFDENEAGVDVFKSDKNIAHILYENNNPDIGYLDGLERLGIQKTKDRIPEMER